MNNQYYWNTKKGVEHYKDGKAFLFDREKIYLLQAIQALGKKTKDIKILDIGCGTGRTTKIFEMMGLQVIGIDNASSMIKEARKKLGNKVRIGDATDLEFSNNSFDIVFFSHNGIDYIQTYTKRIKAYKEAARVLKKNGYFIFSSHIFCPIPFNHQTLLNIFKNINRIIKLLDHGYFIDYLKGESVPTFSASNSSFVAKELEKSGFALIAQSAQLDSSGVWWKNILQTIFSWERYYIALKK